MEDFDIIVGIHSIAEAIKNSSRAIYKIVATDDGMNDLRKRGEISSKDLEGIDIELYASHKFQEMGKSIYKDLDYNFSRIPSGVYLLCSKVELYDVTWIYEKLKNKKRLKILCLDQVTDVHNGAAILRTAAFYGVDCILTASKGNFGMGPNFSRIASGALEHVKIVKCSSLPKMLNKLHDLGVHSIGLSEHASGEFELEKNTSVCLLLGAEDVGLSNALLRVVKEKVSLKPYGQIKSLNVSVAAAVAMEKYFNFE